jgi:methylthioribose-1-phosphate isomerase
MLVNGKQYQTIWLSGNKLSFVTIDQRKLPFAFKTIYLRTWQDVQRAISLMIVRGAPLIGVAGAAGIYLGLLSPDAKKEYRNKISDIGKVLKSTRPTAVNLMHAVDRMVDLVKATSSVDKAVTVVLNGVLEMIEEEKEYSRKIGEHGVALINEISKRKHGKRVNILTHCNAGWLACIDYGTATAPIYEAFSQGIDIHVWVDETRPRNQGARLTAWELSHQGVPHTVITDNAGGHLMQNGMVDLVLVGSDRTTSTGDVANKIGTYLKALAAFDNNVPFYAALPSSTIDFNLSDGIAEIPIEEREKEEVSIIEGINHRGVVQEVRILPETAQISNYGFDVTPARLITGLITERGITTATREGIKSLFPEGRQSLKK